MQNDLLFISWCSLEVGAIMLRLRWARPARPRPAGTSALVRRAAPVHATSWLSTELAQHRADHPITLSLSVCVCVCVRVCECMGL